MLLTATPMEKQLPGLDASAKELAPLNIIRTETALSRFPVHRIAKKGNVRIELRQQAQAVLWRVSHNSEYGQPGPLAYQLDTLIVNRRIEESGRPVPKLIRLGSLRDIAEELGSGEKNTNVVKKSLLQNASAFITAKITYRAKDRTERTLEAGFTRYSVVFTGETLPDGRAADAVYLVLNDIYMEVLNAAITRPLDYDYMKELSAAAQRFYEIVSYQIYAALHYQNERARLRYSEYCLLSTATRYFDFDHVKKQMWKTHQPHLKSGYLAKVGYEETTDAEGQADWWMYYVPGPNASHEYRNFTGNISRPGKGIKRPEESRDYETLPLPFPITDPDVIPSPAPLPVAEDDSNTVALIERLVGADMNRADAERLARSKPEECQRQLEYLPFKTDIENPGGWLRRAIEEGFPAPKEFRAAKTREERERKKREEGEHRKAQEVAQEARRREQAARVDSDIARLEIEAPAAFSAFNAYVEMKKAETRAKFGSMGKSIATRMEADLNRPEKRRELFLEWQRLPPPESPGPGEGEDPESVRAILGTAFDKDSSEK